MRFGVKRSYLHGAALLAACIGAGSGAARAEPDCAEAVRKLIRGDQRTETPVRSRSTTTMAGGTVVNLGLTDGDAHLSMDESGNPVSLFVDNRFYTTPNNGGNWALVQTYSPETMAETRDGLAEQATNARNIACAYGLELDGRPVNHYTADYAIASTGTPVHGEFWVDADTGFAWKAVIVMDPGGNEIAIEQLSEPAPGARLPDPEG